MNCHRGLLGAGCSQCLNVCLNVCLLEPLAVPGSTHCHTATLATFSYAYVTRSNCDLDEVIVIPLIICMRRHFCPCCLVRST